MRRLALAFLLAGCTQQQYYNSASKALVQFTEADLTNAIALAEASAAPEAPLISSCFTFVKTQIVVKTQPLGAPGLATAFVLADLAAGNRMGFAVACGPLIAFKQVQKVTDLGTLLVP